MEPLLNTKQVAEILGTTAKTLEVARCTRSGAAHDLPFIRLGTSIRYRPEEVRAYLDKHTVRSV